MAINKNQRYSDEVLEDLKEYLDLKFEMINGNMDDLKRVVARHDILLVGQNGDTGLVKENNDLKNSIKMLKWVGILISSMVAFMGSFKNLFK